MTITNLFILLLLLLSFYFIFFKNHRMHYKKLICLEWLLIFQGFLQYSKHISCFEILNYRKLTDTMKLKLLSRFKKLKLVLPTNKKIINFHCFKGKKPKYIERETKPNTEIQIKQTTLLT